MTTETILKPNEKGDWEIVLPEKKETVAELEQAGFLKGIMSFELMGVPVGAGVVGGSVAYAATKLAQRFMPQVQAGLANIVMAWLSLQFGKRFLGGEAAKLTATFLVYEAARGYVNPWIDKLLAMIPGGATQVVTGGTVLAQAQAIAANAAKGGW